RPLTKVRAPQTMTPVGMFIDGQVVLAEAGAVRTLTNPSDRSVLAQVADAGDRDVDRAVEASRRAFASWRGVSQQQRGRILLQLAEVVRKRADEVAAIEARNCGKPIVEAESDLVDVATCFEYYGGLATKIHGEVIPVPDEAMVLALREPVGVAA